MRFGELIDEWRARRAGRRYARTHMARAARDVVGPTGNMYSNGWAEMEAGSKAYVQSFDRRVPHSEFIAERDRFRPNIPIPTAERCLEDPDRHPGAGMKRASSS